ncbi:hypothetical protein [uncultured Croceitalea sp.]|uniref:hypothetical protein n=1 Tax=uncultured Croceitalea sp. TaxID=1798908 RepID=UPI00330575BC
MRKISLVLFAVTMLTVGSVSANSNPKTVDPAKALAHQIHDMLERNTFKVTEDLTAHVHFVINKDGEIVVLSVDTENEVLERFVKGRLNYKKVNLDRMSTGKAFTVAVRISA